MRRNLWESFKVCVALPEKIVLYLLTKFSNFYRLTNIECHRRFNLGYWETSKQIFKKLQYSEKLFGKVQGLPCFTRKIVLYSSTKFDIL